MPKQLMSIERTRKAIAPSSTSEGEQQAAAVETAAATDAST